MQDDGRGRTLPRVHGETHTEHRERPMATGTTTPPGASGPAGPPPDVVQSYLQMVGRGLRGPANGGTDRCLIVNVADTFEQFGEQLAYNEFDYLWSKQ